MKISYIFVIFLSTAFVLTTTANNSKEIVKTFTNQKDKSFNHLVIDKNNGRLFVGAVNSLYQLSPNLDLITTEVTGPTLEFVNCSVFECYNKVHKDNVNKALLIDYSNSKLISCGSFHEGACSITDLNNITNNVEILNPVVANTDTASTVAFIAPGPPDPSAFQVMYVGVTWSPEMLYQLDVPAVSSRSLDKNSMFSIASTDTTTNEGTRIFVNSLYRDRYPINYVYGFASEGFSYFLTTQMENTTSKRYISKLVRVCHGDQHFYSYTEIPIECKSNVKGGKSYNLAQAAYTGKAGTQLASDLGVTIQDDVLYAVFSESESNFESKPSDSSAFCVYSLKSIRQKFTQTIQDCMKGKGKLGLDFITPSRQCDLTQLNNIAEDFCGTDVNTPLGGEQPISAIPVLTYNVRLTAVATIPVGDSTVAFIGTSMGHLKKVVVKSSTAGLEYQDLKVDDGLPINSDLHFDPENKYIYAMTEKKISKIKVENCSAYQTCSECSRKQDPYCSWCLLESKCTLQSKCLHPNKSSMCARIKSVNPNKVQKGENKKLVLVIDELLAPQKKLRCAFTSLDTTIITNATNTEHGVECMTPKYDMLPLLPYRKHEFNMTLSVRESEGSDFVTTNFTIYDCNSYTSCTECVSSPYPCNWCVDDHKCIQVGAEECKIDTVVTGVASVDPSHRSGPEFCPAIHATTSGILVSKYRQKQVKVHVQHLGQFMVQSNFTCRFIIEGRVTNVNGLLIDDSIYCDPIQFSYTSTAPYVNASFAVIWGTNNHLDNPNNIHIHIYSCRYMAHSCGMCLITNEEYDCGWCTISESCELRRDCDQDEFLNRNEICTNPLIQLFAPRQGPLEGGTNITIEGVDLGKDFHDIQFGIKIAGIYCRPFEDLYIRTQQITCQVDSPGTDELIYGPVTVAIGNHLAKSEHEYKFVNPTITGISPKTGPRLGGTLITVTGDYLLTGNNIQAFLGDVPCKIITLEQNKLVCITGVSNSASKKKLKIKFDNAERILENIMFEFVKDPVIVSVESRLCDEIKEPAGTLSGGQQITVTVANRISFDNSDIIVYYGKFTYRGACTILSNTKMTCRSPVFNNVHDIKINRNNPLKLKYEIYLYHGLSTLILPGLKSYLLYPDPEFNTFEQGIKLYESDFLTINGDNIDLLCPESNTTVKVGENNCDITSVSRHQLTCRLPEIKFLADSEEKREMKHEVVIYVAGSREYNIGVLLFRPQDDSDHQQGSVEKVEECKAITALHFLEEEHKAKMALLKQKYEMEMEEWELRKSLIKEEHLNKL